MALKGDIPEILRQFVQGELRGLYTVLPAIVEEVRENERRVDVRLKDQRRNVLDNNDAGIPVASPYAGDGYGELYPIKPEDEGFLFFIKDPVQESLTARGEVDVSRHRQHSLNDAIFFPRVFFDDDEIPKVAGDGGVQDLEYLMYHESGTWFRIGEEGVFEVQHRDGGKLIITGESDNEGADIGPYPTGHAPAHSQLTDSRGNSIELDEQGAWLYSTWGNRVHVSEDLIVAEIAPDTDAAGEPIIRLVVDATPDPPEVRVEGRHRVEDRLIAGVEGEPPDDGVLLDLEGAKGDYPPADAGVDFPLVNLYSAEMVKFRFENVEMDYAETDDDIEVGTAWYNETDDQLRILTPSGVQDIQHS